MTHEKFVETVHRLEDFARREPGRYQFRVALPAALGYYIRQGRRDEAEAYRRSMSRRFEELEAAGRERQDFRDGEGILPHGMGPMEVARLAEQPEQALRRMNGALVYER